MMNINQKLTDMKHCKLIPALLILLVLASGCDTVRSWLGKPTSADIEKARLEKAAAEREAARKAAEESAKAAADLASVQPLTQIARYNVVVGAFKNPDNAERLAAKMTKAGETVTKIEFINGFTAISVLNTDDFHAACRKLNATQSSDDLPFDCWIYDANTAKHN